MDDTDSDPPPGVFGLRANSPNGELINFSGLEEEDIDQISLLMNSLGKLRDAERRVSEASALYMELNETDMRALHFLIVNENLGKDVTASTITRHLRVSPATTTKILDRLDKGSHITRSPHPTDRRVTTIRITPETRKAAYETVGALQARRFQAAARLTRKERDVVIRFLQDMTEQIDMKHVDWAHS